MNNLTVELVEYKVKSGVDEDLFLKASEEIMKDIRKLGGFVRREVVKGMDGIWFDILYWNSLSEAQEAAKKVMEHSSCLHFFQMIDESSIKMSHLQQVQIFD
jgi:hypothetical protein